MEEGLAEWISIFPALFAEAPELENKNHDSEDGDDGREDYFRYQYSRVVFHEVDRTIAGDHQYFNQQGQSQGYQQQLAGQNDKRESYPETKEHNGLPMINQNDLFSSQLNILIHNQFSISKLLTLIREIASWSEAVLVW